MTGSARFWLVLGMASMLSAVILAALGAHGPLAPSSALAQRWLATASLFHLTHSLALIGFGLWLGQIRRPCHLPAALLLVGMTLFTGSLYLLVFTTVHFPPLITPIGGGLLMLGWLAWLFAVLLRRPIPAG
ncbi:DUF423 domain-containing protein [Halothiobacillus sp. DCM-1]|uniref:DUF423 domain-containing protein n=1 Tax=Halothiobacillus sp. DCM-1 TaxID=3112558 RepID=UPI00324C848A